MLPCALQLGEEAVAIDDIADVAAFAYRPCRVFGTDIEGQPPPIDFDEGGCGAHFRSRFAGAQVGGLDH